MDRPRRRSELNRIHNDHVRFAVQQRQKINAADAAILKAGPAAGQAVVDLESDRIIGDQFIADTDDYCTAV